jgi:molecular chaperone GrpE (heat shock protein)
MADRKRRQRSEPWKHIYGKDRRYTARIDRMRERQSSDVPDIVKKATADFIEKYRDALDELG